MSLLFDVIHGDELVSLDEALTTQAENCQTLGSPLSPRHPARPSGTRAGPGGPLVDLLRRATSRCAAATWSACALLAAAHRLVLSRRAPGLAAFFPTVGGTAPADDAARAALGARSSPPSWRIRTWSSSPWRASRRPTRRVGRSRCAGRWRRVVGRPWPADPAPRAGRVGRAEPARRRDAVGAGADGDARADRRAVRLRPAAPGRRPGRGPAHPGRLRLGRRPAPVRAAAVGLRARPADPGDGPGDERRGLPEHARRTPSRCPARRWSSGTRPPGSTWTRSARVEIRSAIRKLANRATASTPVGPRVLGVEARGPRPGHVLRPGRTFLAGRRGVGAVASRDGGPAGLRLGARDADALDRAEAAAQRPAGVLSRCSAIGTSACGVRPSRSQASSAPAGRLRLRASSAPGVGSRPDIGRSSQTTFTGPLARHPQRADSLSTRSIPRPPSSSGTRRARQWGAVDGRVADLQAQEAVAHVGADVDRAAGVAHGVRDELGGQQLGVVGQLRELGLREEPGDGLASLPGRRHAVRRGSRGAPCAHAAIPTIGPIRQPGCRRSRLDTRGRPAGWRGPTSLPAASRIRLADVARSALPAGAEDSSRTVAVSCGSSVAGLCPIPGSACQGTPSRSAMSLLDLRRPGVVDLAGDDRRGQPRGVQRGGHLIGQVRGGHQDLGAVDQRGRVVGDEPPAAEVGDLLAGRVPAAGPVHRLLASPRRPRSARSRARPRSCSSASCVPGDGRRAAAHGRPRGQPPRVGAARARGSPGRPSSGPTTCTGSLGGEPLEHRAAPPSASDLLGVAAAGAQRRRSRPARAGPSPATRQPQAGQRLEDRDEVLLGPGEPGHEQDVAARRVSRPAPPDHPRRLGQQQGHRGTGRLEKRHAIGDGDERAACSRRAQ